MVERDKNIISLFKEFILPQFDHPEKIEIVEADAFEYLEKNDPESNFDFMFADLWHDSSDGLGLYIKLKKLEKMQTREERSSLVRRYWIETSILSRLRWLIYSEIISGDAGAKMKIDSFDKILSLLSDASLSDVASDMRLNVAEKM